MATREPLLVLALPLVLGACVRWGVPDDEGFADDFGQSTTNDLTTSTTTDVVDSSSDGGTAGPETGPQRRTRPWPEAWPFAAESRLVVWGHSGIPTTNLQLLANTFYALAGVAPGQRPLTILWIADCDPRIDADGCMAGDVQPFFDMVDGLGTIELASPAMLEPSDYDVVVADFCGPVDGLQIAALLAVGEGVLAMGDRQCATSTGSSAKVANETIAHFGARFISRELQDQRFAVPAEQQVGLLEGVTSLDVAGVSLQETMDPAVAVVETPDGALLGTRGTP